MGSLTRWMFGDRPLSEPERRLVLRAMTAIAIPLAILTTFALGAGFLFFRSEIDGQLEQNKIAIKQADNAIRENEKLALELNDERRNREIAIARAVFNECVQNELQDSVLVNQVLKPAIANLKQDPNPSSQTLRLITSLSLAILTREPLNEKDCKLPGAG